MNRYQITGIIYIHIGMNERERETQRERETERETERERESSETRMTASVLKQVPNT